MTMTDPIADLFTRIRNAGIGRQNKTDIPHSHLKENICAVLIREGYLDEQQVTEVDGRKRIRVRLRQDVDGNSIIERIERVSKPGCRVYIASRDVRRVRRGLGIGLYSTSKGILTDGECREKRIGGEYLGRIW